MGQGTRNHCTRAEIIIYAFLSVLIGIGFHLAWMDDAHFRAFVIEDGVLETGTALVLFITALWIVRLYIRERGQQPLTFTLVTLGMAFLFIIGAGEEISWGQRIFGVESSAFFEANNRQGETNLHNLEVAGVNLNKLFARISALVLLIYYSILPALYARQGRVHRGLSALRLPIPKIHQGVVLVALAIFIDQIPSAKRGEVNEVTISIFMFLLWTYAQNIRHEGE